MRRRGDYPDASFKIFLEETRQSFLRPYTDHFQRQEFVVHYAVWYTRRMAELTKEQAEAVRNSESGRVDLVDPVTNRRYVLLDADSLAFLERESSVDAIRAGLESMQAGRGLPIEEADVQMRDQLGFPPRQ